MTCFGRPSQYRSRAYPGPSSYRHFLAVMSAGSDPGGGKPPAKKGPTASDMDWGVRTTAVDKPAPKPAANATPPSPPRKRPAGSVGGRGQGGPGQGGPGTGRPGAELKLGSQHIAQPRYTAMPDTNPAPPQAPKGRVGSRQPVGPVGSRGRGRKRRT
ncbi:hypothetical protein KIPB_005813 [Kipferlia bialata]|uniref:Uncharacterized protein n=1 Tax=Kipferlia bialata TaxID=797122 RepID=A0A391NU77_9EUKA|nr:hypothetical protein KIPB_005813 [Kipferlia bialata]|eukprot:g5813.t1